MAITASSSLTQISWIYGGPYTEDINRDIKWYSSWASHYFNQGGSGAILAAMEIVPMAIFLCPFVSVITYVVLSYLFKGKADTLCKSAMEEGNVTAAYIMTERGADALQKNSNGQSILDLMALKGERNEGFSNQDLAICETLMKKGVTANPALKGFQMMLDTSLAQKRHTLTLHLLALGVEPSASWSNYVTKTQVEELKLPDWSRSALPSINGSTFLDEDLNSEATKEPLLKFSMKGYPVQQLIRTFGQSMRNCPIILGNREDVRKNLMMALTRDILSDNVPQILQKKRVVGIDLGILDSKTKMTEVNQLLADYSLVLKSNRNLVFYVHNFDVFENKTNAHQKIKDTIAKWAETGRVVFSMTPAIYTRHFAQSTAIQKGFTPVEISRLSEREALPTLHLMKKELEIQHQVPYKKSAVEAAINMAHHLKGCLIPQTPYEILDAAACLLKEQDRKGSVALQEARRIKSDLEFDLQVLKLKNGSASKKRIERTEEQLAEQEEAIKKLEARDHREKAVKKQYLELTAKQTYLKSLDKSLESQTKPLLEKLKIQLAPLEEFKETSNIKFEVDRDLVAAVVSSRSGIPLQRVGGADAEKMRKLEATLGKEVIGQKAAVRTISKTLKMARAGLRNESKPRGVFLCAGTSGTGKTEMAKAIARNIFGDERNMTRLDMSEYQTKENKARLIGAPPGYVGYDQGGQLTEALKQNPYQVILIDEVEKAAPEVLTAFLQVFSDGRLTDGQGNTVDCSQAVFVLTTNLGSREISASQVGYAKYNLLKFFSKQYWQGPPTPEAVIHQVLARSEHFSDELLGRMKVVTFNPLTNPEDLKKIVAKTLKQHQAQAMDVQGIDLSWTDRVVEVLARSVVSVRFGARPLIERIEDVVQNTIAEQIIEGRIKEGDTVQIDYDLNQNAFTFQTVSV